MKKKLHLRQRHNLRLQNSEQARNYLPEDQKKANENPREYHEVSFDLQKAFLYPKLSVPYRIKNTFSIKRMSQPDFISTERYKVLYKTCLDDLKVYVLDLSPKRRTPKLYGNIKLLPLYSATRALTEKKRKAITCLLSYIHPVFRKHFKNTKNW
uniref:Uncharacterized protein n=1 Tax=Glossina palpalis gambiensis TaxID=67801 RepID=A0A1B0B871_9MUSC